MIVKGHYHSNTNKTMQKTKKRKTIDIWVSEWLLFNSAICQLYHGETKLTFNWMMRFALYYTISLSLRFIVLVHWNNSQWINLLSHSDTLSWFRAKQSLLFLLYAVSLTEKQHKLIALSSVWTNWGSNPRSTRGEHTR